MSRKTRTTITVVEKLIEQRRLFQDWMTKLSGEVEGMPGHVVDRVRNDYRARLESVMRELGEHRDALREALEEARDRHEAVDTQAQARRDELAEMRLRRHVGEMDEPRFKEQSAALKVVMDGLGKELAAAQKEIERYEEILGIIAEDEEPAAPHVAHAEPEEVEEEYEEEEEEEEEEEPAPPQRAAAAPAPRAEAPKPAPAPPPPPPPPPPQRKSSDELAFLRSVASAPKASPAPAPAPQPQAAAKPAPQPAKVEAEPDPFDAAPGLVHLPDEDDEDEAPAPAAKAAEPAKKDDSLTCGECGAKNRPTEWYIEKCGAELAAL